MSMAHRNQDELAERIAGLLRDDAQFRATAPLMSVTKAVAQPGLSIGQILRAVLDGYADRKGAR